MQLQFYKYQGTGNDFVLIDNRKKTISLTQKQIEFLCDRRFGIGADGLILLEEEEGYDFKMVYYNSDGRESSMCGNGGRCITRFAMDMGIQRQVYKFLAIDGDHWAKEENGNISLKMIDVLEYDENNESVFIDTGSPHYVEFVEDVENWPLVERAQAIRYSEKYAREGVNVNFVEVKGDGILAMRTYERGVEAETLSCGTGVTAATLSAYIKKNFETGQIEVNTRGGKLQLAFEKGIKGFENIWLKGAASFVFKGEVNL